MRSALSKLLVIQKMNFCDPWMLRKYQYRKAGLEVCMSTALRALVTIWAISISLSGCQNRISQPSSPRVEKADPIPRVIFEGVGMSFEMKQKDVESMGLKLEPMEMSKQVSKWSMTDFDFTKEWQRKSITFTPLSTRVQKFSAEKFYPNNGTKELACFSDYQLVVGKIKTQYQSLVDATELANDPDKLLNTRLCEGKKEPSAYHKSIGFKGAGLGRCISLMCVDVSQGGHMKHPVGSVLEIEYQDLDVLPVLESEENQFLMQNREKMLKRRGIDPSQF